MAPVMGDGPGGCVTHAPVAPAGNEEIPERGGIGARSLTHPPTGLGGCI